jgi:hypothetical protein
LTPILVEAIKAQQRLLDEQKASIDDLRRRLEKLEGNSTDAARTAERLDAWGRGNGTEEKEAGR